MDQVTTGIEHNAYDENLKFIERIGHRGLYNSQSSPWPKNIIYAMAAEILRLRKELDEIALPRRKLVSEAERHLAFAEEDLRKLVEEERDLRASMGHATYDATLEQYRHNVLGCTRYLKHIIEGGHT